uniref:Uncharacterized protein n=1 Tax=Glossina palpalis gambiensis TaxID=67801 RepID=A0A1B0BHJ8_9MUSC
MQKTVAHFMTLLRFTYLVKCLIINVKVERFGSFISSNALRIVSIPSSSLRLRPKRSYISCGINGAPSSRKNCFSKLVICSANDVRLVSTLALHLVIFL